MSKIDDYIIDGYFQPWSNTLHARFGWTHFLSAATSISLFVALGIWIIFTMAYELRGGVSSWEVCFLGFTALVTLVFVTFEISRHRRWERFVGKASMIRNFVSLLFFRTHTLLIVLICVPSYSLVVFLTGDVVVLATIVAFLSLSCFHYFECCVVTRPPRKEVWAGLPQST